LKLRRTSLAIMTATAVALSALSPVAGAEEGSDQTPPVTANDEVDQWPGSVEGSSMLSSGEIPTAPEFGSSQLGSSEKEKEEEKEEDKGSGLVDENGNIPVIGSISLPGWLAVPIGVIQVVMAVSTFAAQAAYMVLSVHPQGSQIVRDWLLSVGINPDA
jgi:hypothetical protein